MENPLGFYGEPFMLYDKPFVENPLKKTLS